MFVVQNPAFRFGLRAADGEVLWSAPHGGTWLADTGKDGLLYGGSDRGELIAIDPQTGAVVRRIDLASLAPDDKVATLPVRRGALPPAAELGELSAPRFLGDVCYLSAASGWTVAVRLPLFQGG